MSVMETAIRISVMAYRGRKTSKGMPYIMHPIRLMSEVRSEEAQIVAILHAAVQDGLITIDGLEREGFGRNILEALTALARSPEECRSEHKTKIRKNPLAMEVYEADIVAHQIMDDILPEKQHSIFEPENELTAV